MSGGSSAAHENDERLYLGFDLSTQQLKVAVIDGKLQSKYEFKVEFDSRLSRFKHDHGVLIEGDYVFASVKMWFAAVDLLLQDMKAADFPFHQVKAISGAGQQHGSVYWSKDAPDLLKNADPDRSLEDQLDAALSHQYSPNWQDHSTTKECREFEDAVGGPEQLARITGSRAHHRFTGPQILHFRRRYPKQFQETLRISLVSSFIASIFLGSIAPFDFSDVGGMNLWAINQEKYDDTLLELAAGGPEGKASLASKLGEVHKQSDRPVGPVSSYMQQKYGFSKDCVVAPFTGDNPSTILSMPLRANDIVVSLGTSTTLLLCTPAYTPSAGYHLFSHPTSPGLYMAMLCYKNGSHAREMVRDNINKREKYDGDNPWALFNKNALNSAVLGRENRSDPYKLGIYFELPEIIPDAPAGNWRFLWDGSDDAPRLLKSSEIWPPKDDARTIVESQAISMRVRSRPLLQGSGGLPRRIFVVGGASRNDAITIIISEVLGHNEGVCRLSKGVSAGACATGSANRAAWMMCRKEGQMFEDFMIERWDLEGNAEKLDENISRDLWKEYEVVERPYWQCEDAVKY